MASGVRTGRPSRGTRLPDSRTVGRGARGDVQVAGAEARGRTCRYVEELAAVGRGLLRRRGAHVRGRRRGGTRGGGRRRRHEPGRGRWRGLERDRRRRRRTGSARAQRPRARGRQGGPAAGGARRAARAAARAAAQGGRPAPVRRRSRPPRRAAPGSAAPPVSSCSTRARRCSGVGVSPGALGRPARRLEPVGAAQGLLDDDAEDLLEARRPGRDLGQPVVAQRQHPLLAGHDADGRRPTRARRRGARSPPSRA